MASATTYLQDLPCLVRPSKYGTALSTSSRPTLLTIHRCVPATFRYVCFRPLLKCLLHAAPNEQKTSFRTPDSQNIRFLIPTPRVSFSPNPSTNSKLPKQAVAWWNAYAMNKPNLQKWKFAAVRVFLKQATFTQRPAVSDQLNGPTHKKQCVNLGAKNSLRT